MVLTKRVQLKLKSDRLCLDFVNTLDWHASDQPIESLNTYTNLIEWAQNVNLIDELIADQLLEEAKHDPGKAEDVLNYCKDLREVLYRIFVASVTKRSPKSDEISKLNSALTNTMNKACLLWTEGNYVWDWGGEKKALDQIMWWVLQSAIELLTSNDLHRLGQCADDRGCGWFFLDTSKNHTRRWCNMGDCGNRAKARRHYQKEREITTII